MTSLPDPKLLASDIANQAARNVMSQVTAASSRRMVVHDIDPTTGNIIVEEYGSGYVHDEEYARLSHVRGLVAGDPVWVEEALDRGGLGGGTRLVVGKIAEGLDDPDPGSYQPLSTSLTNFDALSGSGILVKINDVANYALRQIVAGSSKVSVSNGFGVAGDPTVDVVESALTLTNLGGTLSVAKGGTGGTTQATARTGLGLVIGTDVQAQNANLAQLAGLTLVADRLPYANGAGTLTLATFTAAGRALVDDADATAQRATLGVVIGTNVQAFSSELTAMAAALTATGFAARTAANTYAMRTIQANSLRVTVTNGAGIAGNPLLDVSEANLVLSSIGGTLASSQLAATLTGKTLTSPTIAAFNNANHTHQNASGGGTLDAAAIAAGTIAAARLPTTLAGLTLTTATLTAPAIGDFTNATHAHTSASSGGALDAAAIATGILATDRLGFAPTAGYILMDVGGLASWVTPALSGNLYALGGGSVDGALVVFDGTAGNVIRMPNSLGYEAKILGGATLGVYGGGDVTVNDDGYLKALATLGPSVFFGGPAGEGYVDGNLSVGQLTIYPSGAGVLRSSGFGVVSSGTHNHHTAAEGGQLSTTVTLGPFYANDLAASATVDLQAGFFNAATTLSQSTMDVYMPLAGEIIGIFAMTDANRTAGNCIVGIKTGGVTQSFDGGAVCAIDSINTRRHSVMVATGDGEDFAAGGRVSLYATTSGWAPTTADLIAWITVRLDY